MKPTKKFERLTIKRETVQVLVEDELARARGGGMQCDGATTHSCSTDIGTKCKSWTCNGPM